MPPVPIAEMITTDHSAANIANFLVRIKCDFCKVTFHTLKLQKIEVDNSFAMLNAVSNSININTLPDYINSTWESLKTNSDWNKTI